MMVVVLVVVQGSMVLLYNFCNSTIDMISHKLWLPIARGLGVARGMIFTFLTKTITKTTQLINITITKSMN